MKSKKMPVPFIWLSLITILPVIVSTYLFFHHDSFKFKTINHGVLINPVVNVTDMDSIGHKKKWRIVYVNDGHCDDQCKKLSFQLHQLTKIVNKDRDRTDVLVLNGADKKLQNKLVAQHIQNVTGKIYLVDPIGNLFMYYSESADPMFILKDLQRVLEVSQIG